MAEKKKGNLDEMGVLETKLQYIRKKTKLVMKRDCGGLWSLSFAGNDLLGTDRVYSTSNFFPPFSFTVNTGMTDKLLCSNREQVSVVYEDVCGKRKLCTVSVKRDGQVAVEKKEKSSDGSKMGKIFACGINAVTAPLLLAGGAVNLICEFFLEPEEFWQDRVSIPIETAMERMAKRVQKVKAACSRSSFHFVKVAAAGEGANLRND